MVTLYIDDKIVDLDTDVDIVFNYKLEETNSPTATKNNYSKTVKIPRTPNNIRIFGFSHIPSNTVYKLTDRHYYKLVHNAILTESGYIVVDSIDNDYFNVTLYGNIGDFFVDLQLNPQGKDLSWKDLTIGLKNTSGQDYSDEDNDTLFTLNSNYVSAAWTRLNTTQMVQINDFAIPLPTYNGMYDDFSADKVIMQLTNATDDIKDIVDARDDSKYYEGNIIITPPRELMPFEAKEFRANRLKFGFPVRHLLTMIKNYESDKFNVSFSTGIRNSNLYTKGYIVRDEITFDEIELNTKSLNADPKVGYGYAAQSVTQTSTFDTRGYEKPRYKFDYYLGMNAQQSDENIRLTRNIYYNGESTSTGIGVLYGGYYIKIKPQYKNNNVWVDCPSVQKLVWFDIDGQYRPDSQYVLNSFNYNGSKHSFTEVMQLKYGIDVSQVEFSQDSFDTVASPTFTSKNKISGDLLLTDENGYALKKEEVRFEYTLIKISLTYCWTTDMMSDIDTWNRDMPSNIWFNDDWSISASFIYTTAYNNQQILSLYDGDEYFNNKSNVVTKTMLFNGMATPYKYLIGLAKAYHWRFVVNDNKINIMTDDEFFSDTRVDITDKITNKTECNPILSEYKYFDYGFETADTYVDYLYKQKYGNETYGHFLFNTNSNINSEVNDTVMDSVYRSIGDYNQLSNNNKIWRTNQNVVIPSNLMFGYSTKTDYTNGSLEDANESNINLASTIYAKTGKSLIDINKSTKCDIPYMICCFDKDSKNKDITAGIVYFNGMYESPAHWRITNDNVHMSSMNDNTSCYCWFDVDESSPLPSAFVVDNVNYGTVINKIPLFGVNRVINNNVVESAMFSLPKIKFNVDYNWDANTSSYDLFWKEYLTSIYTSNQRKITAYVFLNGYENNNSLFQDTYLFEGCEWYLNEIIDWNKSKPDFYKCIFIKKDKIR